MLWFLYIIRCADNSLYTGVTMDVERRFQEHASQGHKCAKYLRGKGPLSLVYVSKPLSKKDAHRYEHQVKSWPKRQKEHLIHSELKHDVFI